MAGMNKMRALNRLPYDFEDGLKISGVDVTTLNQMSTANGAGLVGFTPVGNLGSTNVQAAIAELDVEKVDNAALAASAGSSLVGYDGSTVQAVLDNAKPISDYTALRAYTGRATQIRITTTGIAGFFYRDDADTSSVDNGGTIIVASNGKRWKRVFDDTINVKWFGAKGNASTDDTVAIQTALTLASSISSAKGVASASSNMILSVFPAPIVFFPSGVYKISSELYVNARHICIKGERATLTTMVDGVLPNSFIIRFNEAYQTYVEGMVFASTENGAVIVNAPNIGSALMTFKNCTFMGHKTYGGMGLQYGNQSSLLRLDNCLFQSLAYAFYNTLLADSVGADFVDISSCWFDMNFPFTRNADSGYIRLSKGKVDIRNCLFASGPALGSAANNRVAFIDCDGATGQTDLVISQTRIGFENGAATLINWRQPFNTNVSGSEMIRSGFTITDCTFSPRGENVTYGVSEVATPVVRLYEMPNRIWIVNNNARSTNIGWLVANGTTSNDALYNYAAPYILANSRKQNLGLCSYRIENNNAKVSHLIPTTTSKEYAKWLHLFNAFNYAFLNTNENPDIAWTSLNIDTFYSGDFLDAGIFEVSNIFTHSSTGVKYARKWTLRIVKNPVAATYSFLLQNDDDAAPVNGQSITLTPFFVNSANEAQVTIPSDSVLSNYYLRLTLSANAGSFSMHPLYVKPIRSNDISTGTNGSIAQYRFSS